MSAMRNVVLSYMRDGMSKKDAVREAQKWLERMERRRIERAETLVSKPRTKPRQFADES